MRDSRENKVPFYLVRFACLRVMMYAQEQSVLEIDGETHNIGISLAPDASGVLCVTNANENSVTQFDYYAREVTALYASEPFDKSPGSICGPCRCVLQNAHTLLLAEFRNNSARFVDLTNGSTLAEWKVEEAPGGGAFAVATNRRFIVIGTRVPTGALDEDEESAPSTSASATSAAGGSDRTDMMSSFPRLSPATSSASSLLPVFSPIPCDDAAEAAAAGGAPADAGPVDAKDDELGCSPHELAILPPQACARVYIFDAAAAGAPPLCVLPVTSTCAIVDVAFIGDTSTLLVLPLGTSSLEVIEMGAVAEDATTCIVTSRRELELRPSTRHLTALCVLDAFPSTVFVADQAANCVRAYALSTGELLFQQHVIQPVGLTVEQPDTLIVLGAGEKQSLITTFKIHQMQVKDE